MVSVKPEQLMWVNKKKGFGVSTPFENPQRKMHVKTHCGYFLLDTKQTQTANLNYTTEDVLPHLNPSQDL